MMAAVWSQRRIGNALRRGTLALALVILGGCSNLARPSEAAPPATPPPYVSLAANYLRAVLKDRAAYEDFRISPPRWVNSSRGGAGLLACTFRIAAICAHTRFS